MIENFIEGQNNFNKIRRDFGLSEIPVRDHNNFFDQKLLRKFMQSYFELSNEENISSSYYLVSRIIYSSICEKNGLAPDYRDIHHELAAQLPFVGDFGPVKALTFERKAIYD